MKKKLMILAGLFMIFQFGYSLSCARPPYYDVKEKNITHNKYGTFKELKKVDFETFKGLDAMLGIDKEHVYYEGKIIKNIDAKTFEIISWYKPKAIKGSPWGIGCQFSYIEKFKDKNGTYELKDIQNGKLKLEE